MFHKTRLLLLITMLFAAIILLITGCDSSRKEEETTSQIEDTQIETPPEGEPAEITLKLSHAPKVGETAELTFTIDVLTSGLKPITKVWIEFERYDPSLRYPLGRGRTKERNLERLSDRSDPSDFYYVQLKKKAAEQPETLVPQELVMVSGDLNWEGSPLKEGDKVRLSATVRFPEEGEWLVNAWWAGEEYLHVRTRLRLTVAEDSGVFGWPSDYQPAMAERVSDEEHPLNVHLHIAKAPRLGEATELTYSITSIRDVAEAKAQVVFYVMEKGGWKQTQVPIEDILIKGDLSWEGSLEKDTPVQFSAIINFPLEGDWSVELLGTSPEDSGGCGDSLFLNVTKEIGRFSWVERHINDEEIEEELVPSDWE